MEFYSWTGEYDRARKHSDGTHEGAMRYLHELRTSPRHDWSQQIYDAWVARVGTELDWADRQRPYYNLWPKIIEPLSKLKLSGLLLKAIPKPTPDVVLVRFPRPPHAITLGECTIMSALVTFVEGKSMSVFAAHLRDDGEPVCECFSVLDDGEDVEEQLANLVRVSGDDAAKRDPLRRLMIGLFLMAGDPDSTYLSPIVLAKDRAKWEETKDPALVERAKRRGNFGWDVGREIHCNPHWRQPHAALYHTGKGRLIPKVIFRKGALVKRETAQKMPTGYLDHEEPNANY